MKTKLIHLAGLVLALAFTGCTTAQTTSFENDVNKVATDVSDASTAIIKVTPDVVTVVTDVGTGASAVAKATAPASTGNTTAATPAPLPVGGIMTLN